MTAAADRGVLTDAAPPSRRVLGMRVDSTSYADATDRIIAWARAGESRYVCVAAVNNVMLAREDRSFAAAMERADLVTPDGMPLVWGLRRLGVKHATRVYGPDLMPSVLASAASAGIPVGLYGGSPEVVEKLKDRISAVWPGAHIAYAFSPPFTDLGAREDAEIATAINGTGVRILFVGLGCPKQERWMAGHRGSVQAVMVGVGAAFDFLAGAKRQAPRWIQRMGLEWLFRLLTEPKRLWRRYLTQNPRFAMLFAKQVLIDRRT